MVRERKLERPKSPSAHVGHRASGEADRVVFLGQELAPDEYQSICSALKGFFDILSDWQMEQSNAE